MNQPMFESKVAVVTGAARGIGRAIANRFAEEGAAAVIVDLKNAGAAAREIAGRGLEAAGYDVDITDYEAVQAMMADAAGKFGTIDILVNNAGIIDRGTILDITFERWLKVIDVNVNGTFICCKAAIPYMVKQSAGKIVNVTSIAGKMGDLTASPVYGTSKGAVNTLTKSLARQLADYRINVNAVAPHAIETDMSAEWSEEKRKQIVGAIPLKRLGKPEEVAEAVLFLASEKAAFITGEIMDINGGYLMD